MASNGNYNRSLPTGGGSDHPGSSQGDQKVDTTKVATTALGNECHLCGTRVYADTGVCRNRRCPNSER